MILRRHVTFIILNMFCQLYANMSRVVNLISRKDVDIDSVPTRIAIVLFFGQGVWLNLIRLLEPGYPSVVAQCVHDTLCSVEEQDD